MCKAQALQWPYKELQLLLLLLLLLLPLLLSARSESAGRCGRSRAWVVSNRKGSIVLSTPPHNPSPPHPTAAPAPVATTDAALPLLSLLMIMMHSCRSLPCPSRPAQEQGFVLRTLSAQLGPFEAPGCSSAAAAPWRASHRSCLLAPTPSTSRPLIPVKPARFTCGPARTPLLPLGHGSRLRSQGSWLGTRGAHSANCSDGPECFRWPRGRPLPELATSPPPPAASAVGRLSEDCEAAELPG